MIASVSQRLRKTWPSRSQRGAQFGVVVDLAVEDDDDRTVLVVHRLLAAADVDDREPPVAKPHARLGVEAVAIRAAMADRRRHPAQGRLVHGPRGIHVEQTRKPAHRPVRSVSRRPQRGRGRGHPCQRFVKRS